MEPLTLAAYFSAGRRLTRSGYYRLTSDLLAWLAAQADYQPPLTHGSLSLETVQINGDGDALVLPPPGAGGAEPPHPWVDREALADLLAAAARADTRLGAGRESGWALLPPAWAGVLRRLTDNSGASPGELLRAWQALSPEALEAPSALRPGLLLEEPESDPGWSRYLVHRGWMERIGGIALLGFAAFWNGMLYFMIGSLVGEGALRGEGLFMIPFLLPFVGAGVGVLSLGLWTLGGQEVLALSNRAWRIERRLFGWRLSRREGTWEDTAAIPVRFNTGKSFMTAVLDFVDARGRRLSRWTLAGLGAHEAEEIHAWLEGRRRAGGGV